MRIHGIHLRGLTAPTGDHQLGLDAGYTVVRLSDREHARRFARLASALLYPETGRAAERDSSGRAVLTLALRTDACLVAADFARRRLSLGRHDAKGGGYQGLSSDPHEIEEYMLAVGLPPAVEFERLHVFALEPEGSAAPDSAARAARAAARHAALLEARRAAEATAAAAHAASAERTRRIADHEERVLSLATERARREAALEGALAAARGQRSTRDESVRELRALDAQLTELEREHKTVQAELDKNAVLADVVEDFDTRLAQFRVLAAQRDEERLVVEDMRRDLLAERGRLRGGPRRQAVPIGLGVLLGVAGSAAGLVGYPAAFALGGAGVLVLLGALVAVRIAHVRLTRVETLLATLRVRERASERRFETEGAQLRGIMLALGLESPEALSAAAVRYAEESERAEALKAQLAQLSERYPPGAREKLARLEQESGVADAAVAVRAARDALLALPAEPAPLALEDAPKTPPPLVAAVPAELDDDEDDTAGTLPPAPPAGVRGPEDLIACAARVLARSESEIRARIGSVLPVYLRALTAGTFTNARAGEGSAWVLRGAARDEQPYTALPEREKALVRLAVQLALLEALATDRRVPLLVGPDLPALSAAEQRSLARALKRLASVVQVIQVATESEPWSEHAARLIALP